MTEFARFELTYSPVFRTRGHVIYNSNNSLRLLGFPCEMCANESHFQTICMFVLKRITEEFNNFFIDL